MRRLFVALAAFLLALTAFAPARAAAATSTAAYDLHIADQFLQDAVGSPPWAIAQADNGDTVAVRGTGEFDAGAKTASASGVFVHHVAATGQDLTGTWTASRLISFQFYGSGAAQGLPPAFAGGLAKLAVTLTPDAAPSLHFAGVLWVDCLLGDKIPPSRHEGIRLSVKDLINFNKTVHSGFTVFVEQ